MNDGVTRWRRRVLAAAAMGLDLVALGLGARPAAALAATRCAPVQAASARRYAGALAYYIADLKPSFPEHQSYTDATAITEGNFRAVLDGLAQGAGANGIRLPIVPAYAGKADYPGVYSAVYEYARALGLLIYASPMAVGPSSFAGWSDERYAAWLARYAEDFRPDVLSPFNEAGFENARLATITRALRAKLSVPVRLMGPDRQHVDRSVQSLARDPTLASLFDIVNSHNADGDASATAQAWSQLASVAQGRPVWSSENPANWGGGQREGLPGLDQALAGGVQGIVVWKAKPGLVDSAGHPTAKACDIAGHLITKP